MKLKASPCMYSGTKLYTHNQVLNVHGHQGSTTKNLSVVRTLKTNRQHFKYGFREHRIKVLSLVGDKQLDKFLCQSDSLPVSADK